MAWAYMVKCSDGTFYVGSTTDLDARMEQHASGRGARYTSRRLPVELVWSGEFADAGEAWAVERQLHGWSRAKKQALVDGRFHLLPELASRPSARRPHREP
ncbi:GIY-YIG nuclease family protein [Propioniciclava sinopodophylli]|uniref:GIY-YIG nuclease family protein n=1 Tax=Propioniciclava sinopodophylli TaxID=1837344 RepID=UPI002490C7E7|nr:GIY-YIG nuclease family protein [Propioniciclava sinopodophylli]